ncbi:MAG: DUF2442 domain-containing protein [Selenomonadaceae bacterium]|nr:DUF2442 domain-containing protein [Selenomonadaceae bacterium]
MRRELMPTVLQAVAGKAYTVYAYMNDGTVRLLDMSKFMQKPQGVFRRIAEPEMFRELLTVLNGTVAWDTGGNMDRTSCIDIDPYTVYESPIVKDPLQV